MLFAGSERGGQRAAAMYSLIGTAKLNGIDPQAWLADVIARIPTCQSHACLSCCHGSGPPARLKPGSPRDADRAPQGHPVRRRITGPPRFDVPLKIKLNRLHEVIQAAMGWTDTHLYEFRAGGVGWGVPDPDGFTKAHCRPARPACSTSLKTSGPRPSTTSTTSATMAPRHQGREDRRRRARRRIPAPRQGHRRMSPRRCRRLPRVRRLPRGHGRSGP